MQLRRRPLCRQRPALEGRHLPLHEMPARDGQRDDDLRSLAETVVRGHGRHERLGRSPFLPNCGSPLFSAEEGHDEVEIKIGTLDDAPSALEIDYELWIPRREPWLSPIAGAEPFEGDADRKPRKPG